MRHMRHMRQTLVELPVLIPDVEVSDSLKKTFLAKAWRGCNFFRELLKRARLREAIKVV